MTAAATADRVAARLGYWSAMLTALFCVLFTVAALLTEARLLPAPWDVILPIAPSLLLAPSFLVMLVCVNAVVPSERKIWSQLGVAFGCVYVPLCVAAYIVELFVVEPRVLRGASSETALLTLVRGDSVFNAIDGIGYVFMCLATFFAAPAFGGNRLERWIRWLFVATGTLAVPIFLTYFVNRSFMWAAAFWSLTITASAVLLAIFFRRAVESTDYRGRRSTSSDDTFASSSCSAMLFTSRQASRPNTLTADAPLPWLTRAADVGRPRAPFDRDVTPITNPVPSAMTIAVSGSRRMTVRQSVRSLSSSCNESNDSESFSRSAEAIPRNSATRSFIVDPDEG